MVWNAYKWKSVLAIYVLGSAYEKFDVWNEVCSTVEIPMWATRS